MGDCALSINMRILTLIPNGRYKNHMRSVVEAEGPVVSYKVRAPFRFHLPLFWWLRLDGTRVGCSVVVRFDVHHGLRYLNQDMHGAIEI